MGFDDKQERKFPMLVSDIRKSKWLSCDYQGKKGIRAKSS